ncbi:hypothetical protein FisN_3Hu002 [Fistulifera solaris]|uniref:Uncharacterized protein n=1 Tax=Fistulifera solaris TaxID=1519565 RepID=A0A1Z5K0E3_FISSO|nr:hypothetical protein FisN_3Hu002 [Fistulifera solaris]|eukprot:GAX19773.1 hypothetical protein FisN_3Hu002 [Fistulifera solaris]
MKSKSRRKLLKASEEEEDDYKLFAAAQQSIQAQAMIIDELAAPSEDAEMGKDDNRKLPRRKRRIFNAAKVLQMIYHHYTGPTPLFDDRHFATMFRISRQRFQCKMEDFAASEIPYFQLTRSTNSPSLKAKLLYSLKTLAFGASVHQFSDYFEMLVEACRQCLFQFDDAMRRIYTAEYL